MEMTSKTDRDERALRRAIEDFLAPLVWTGEAETGCCTCEATTPPPPRRPRWTGAGWLVPVPMLAAFAMGNNLLGWWLHAATNATVMALICFAPARIWWPGRRIARALGLDRDPPRWPFWALVGAGCGLLLYWLPFFALHGITW